MIRILYGLDLITILDHCEDHRLDYTDLVQGRVMFLLFNTLSRFVNAFLPKSKMSSDFIAIVTISDFRAQEEEICPKTLPGEKYEVGRITSFSLLGSLECVCLYLFKVSGMARAFKERERVITFAWGLAVEYIWEKRLLGKTS